MYYYEVLVGALSYHGDAVLTYSSAEELSVGSAVEVGLRSKIHCGVVAKSVPKPGFKTKPITRAISTEPIPAELLELRNWLADYYPAPAGQITNLIAPSYLLSKLTRQPKPEPEVPRGKSPVIKLTDDQQKAITKVSTNSTTSFMLHGDTGTGKTQVYIELARQAQLEGKSVLALTPEIGLTPQLAENMASQLDYQVVVLHSNLTPARRARLWHKINNSTKPLVVIGAR